MDLSDASEKSPVTRLGIDPGTFRLVVQCLNHYATPGPRSDIHTSLRQIPERNAWGTFGDNIKMFSNETSFVGVEWSVFIGLRIGTGVGLKIVLSL
jgi:hypothetical protein